MDWNQIFKYFLTTTFVTAAIVYLAKVLLDKLAESRVEKYKVNLQKETESFKHELNLEAKRFRNELNTSAIEHQIIYSKLCKERGQIVKKIYNLPLELVYALTNLTTLFQGPEWETEITRSEKAFEVSQILKRIGG